MAFRYRVDAGRQKRHTLSNQRHSDALAFGGDRTGRQGRRAHCQRRPVTRARMGLRRVSVAQQADRVQAARLELPRGPPWMPMLRRTAVIADVGRFICRRHRTCDRHSRDTDRPSWRATAGHGIHPAQVMPALTWTANVAVIWGCSAIEQSVQPR
jgi:hypothetical protein